MRNKVLSIMMVLAVVVAACGGGEVSDPSTTEQEPVTTTTVETPTTTEAPTTTTTVPLEEREPGWQCKCFKADSSEAVCTSETCGVTNPVDCWDWCASCQGGENEAALVFSARIPDTAPVEAGELLGTLQEESLDTPMLDPTTRGSTLS